MNDPVLPCIPGGNTPVSPSKNGNCCVAFSAQGLEVSFTYKPRITWAHEYAGVPIVSDVCVLSGSDQEITDLVLEFSLDGEFGPPFVGFVPSFRHRFMSPNVDLGFHSAKLQQLIEQVKTFLHVTVRRGAELIGETRAPINILAHNEFDPTILPELLACFVTPNAEAIQRILAHTRDILRESTGDPTFDGYQRHSRSRVQEFIGCLYQAIIRSEITYAPLPSSFESTGQKVRFPDQVLQHRMGNCLDLSLFFAAAMEQIGLHPIIVLGGSHALPGCWLVEDWHEIALLEEQDTVTKLVEAGDLMVFESTSGISAQPLSFQESMNTGFDTLRGKDFFRSLLDIKAARLARLLPLPIGVTTFRSGSEISMPVRAERPISAPEGTPTPTPLPPEFQRLSNWKEKLLDLTNRNRMLNYRASRTLTVDLAVPDLGSFEDRLSGGVALTIKPLETEAEATNDNPRSRELLDRRTLEPFCDLLREQLQRGFLFARLPAQDLRRRLQLIVRRARTEVEESGVSTLFVAIGMLHWYDAPGEKPRMAPLLLYPVEVRRTETPGEYSVKLRSDEPRINETLLEKLRREFNLDFQELRQLPLDDSGIDIDKVLTTMRRAIARMQGFEIRESAVLDFFSFTKFLMWRDLDRHHEALLRNDLVRHLVKQGCRETLTGTKFPEPHEIDRQMPPGSPPLILDADSSQQTAIAAALAGKSFVLQGPPGTGKSQTIANILAACLFEGRKVLFVAEKQVALEVVARRLEACGLGSFFLELHSHRAERGAVAKELSRTLAQPVSPPPHPSEVDERLRRLEGDIAALNAYVERIHAPTPLGMSLFEAVGRLSELQEQTTSTVQQRFANPGAVTSECFSQMREHLRMLAEAAKALPTPVDHPLAPCRPGAWSKSAQEEWRRSLENLVERTTALRIHGSTVARHLNIDASLPPEALQAVSRLLRLIIQRIPPGSWSILASPDFPSLRENIQRIALLSRERATLQETLEKHFDPRLVEQDLQGLKTLYLQNRDRNFLARWWNLRSANSLLSSLSRKPLPDDNGILDQLELAMKIKFLNTILATEHQGMQHHLGASALQTILDPQEMELLGAFISTADECRSTLRKHGPDLVFPVRPPADQHLVASHCQELEKDLEAFRQGFASVQRIWRIDPKEAFGETFERLSLERIGTVLPCWLDSWPKLYGWCQFIQSEEAVLDDGFDALAKGLRAGTLTAEELVTIGEREFLEAWIREVVAATPELRNFSHIEQERRISRFRDDDRRTIASSGQVIAARLANQRPDPSVLASEASEVGILQREARKKSGHLAIRRLFEQIPNLLGRIKPCFLMSPLSVAQYLPAARAPFDLVIFDEASQITVYDAIGAIARGRQVIVVGDSRQLPPTLFFTIGNEDREEEATSSGDEPFVQDLESILDECVASQLPSLMLRWHYRSRDERLIAFSNIHYYESNLSTFPAARSFAEGAGVSLVEVDGVFERGGSRTNPIEVEAVCQWVVTALRDPRQRGRSIGIVTFNQPQQMAIEDRLESLRREHPEIEPYFSERANEPVFIKNLENVQGDERDVMLFSVTYGPDRQGLIGMNFGPLNRAGGERRLNVAITRARESLVVFSSLKPEAIDLSRTRSIGVEHLRSFLRYAALGPTVLPQPFRQTETADSLAGNKEAAALQQALINTGFHVERQIGCSAYRLDLAVRGQGSGEGFLLGIETDGPSYRSGATVRDRDRLRAEVLSKLGWNLHRIWLPDWWRDPKGEIERIHKALAKEVQDISGTGRPLFPGANEQLKEDPKPPQEQSHAIDSQTSPAEIPATTPEAGAPSALPPSPPERSPVLEYSAYPVEPCGTPDSFHTLKGQTALDGLLERIIGHEAPVHQEECALRAAACFGFKRIGTKIRERVEERLAALSHQKRVFHCGPIFWKNPADVEAPSQVRGPASDGTLRKPEHLPPEEAAAAAILVLRGSIALPRPILAREAAILMGFKRPSEAVLTAFHAGIERLLAQGICKQSGEQIHLT